MTQTAGTRPSGRASANGVGRRATLCCRQVGASRRLQPLTGPVRRPGAAAARPWKNSPEPAAALTRGWVRLLLGSRRAPSVPTRQSQLFQQVREPSRFRFPLLAGTIATENCSSRARPDRCLDDTCSPADAGSKRIGSVLTGANFVRCCACCSVACGGAGVRLSSRSAPFWRDWRRSG